jgi:hypothetical protein
MLMVLAGALHATPSGREAASQGHFSFATLTSTTLQLHSSPAYWGQADGAVRVRLLGTTLIGSALTGWISSAAGPRGALLTGAAACLLAGAIAVLIRTPPNPDAALTDLP